MSFPVRITVALLAGAALAGCGGSSHPAGAIQPTRTATSPPASTAPTTNVSASPSPTSTAQAGGPVPAGFVPASVTAISPTTFWVLGTAPCATAPCTSLVRTTDGGAHFVGLPAPRAALGQPQPDPTSPATDVSQVRFADAQDGWAFGPALWATHNGGASWHPVSMPGEVFALAAANGQVWALGGDCQPKAGCSSYWLRRSPVGSDAFTTVSLPVPLSGSAPFPALALHGSTVYLLDNGVTTGGNYQSTLLVSTDGGAHFSRETAPCSTDLGGSLSAAPGAIWAVCPTGMLSGNWRSTDGGVHFTRVSAPNGGQQPNSARLAAASATQALLSTTGTTLYVTTDAGAHWSPGRVPANLAGTAMSYLGMTDTSVGYAISLQSGGAAALLRTTDGGATWAGVAF